MRSILLFILFISSSTVFALSPIKETFVIRNYSSKTVIINVEYSDDPDKIFYDERSWIQNLYGINLTFYAHVLDAREFRLKPNQIITIIDYYPRGNDEVYTRLDNISFMDKIKSIYKSLRIAIEDGGKVITLENLGEQIIKKNAVPGGISYYLEIFDYDLAGKPAAEW